MKTCNYYPIFEANQVLTADQLNQLVSYLERQERLTRNKLIGVGIVCGLDVAYSSSPATIVISEGCGITSEGYLITLEESTFTRYREYIDPVSYPVFRKDDDSQIDLWELLPATVEVEDESIQPLTESVLQNKAILLYLECREVDLRTCTGDDCDEKGIRAELCVKPLLIAQSDLTNILTAADLPLKHDKFELPELRVNRLYDLLSSGLDIKFTTLYNAYEKAISPILEQVGKILAQIYSTYKLLLQTQYENNPFDSEKLVELFKETIEKNPPDIQYFYDFLKDLILAYNEFKEAAFHLMTECCPDEAKFPKHLMLGEATGNSECIPSIYRQSFISAPIHNGQNHLLKEVLMLFTRMVLLINNFQIPKVEEVKITPSKEKGTPLSLRSIPYYYEIQDSFNEFWNFELKHRCKSDLILSYHAEKYVQDSTPKFILTPLEYNLDEYPFLRIEGHLGQSYKVIFEKLSKQVNTYNLPIKILGLKLGSKPDETKTASACQFQDLELLYIALRSELVCLLKREIAFFANLEYGNPPRYEDGPTGVRGTVKDASGAPLPGVNVAVKNTTSATVTDAKGAFQFTKLSPEKYTLTASFTGFATREIPIEIKEDKTLVVDIRLTSSPGRDIKPGSRASVKPILTEKGALSTGRKKVSFFDQIRKGTGRLQGQFMEFSLEQAPSQYTIGAMYQAFTESPGVDELGFVSQYLAQEQPDLTFGEISVIVVNQIHYPLQMIKNIEALVATLTEDLQEFRFDEFSDQYDALITTAKNYREQITNPKYQLKGNEQEILEHLNNLIESCNLQQFQSLVDAYQARLREIQELHLFGNFLQKNPGLEHQAGVVKGGTFLLVYDDDSNVVADFSLPYLCCSDCPPIHICESTSVVFKLPKASFCKDDDTEYKFILSPPGGEVTETPGVRRDEATGDYYFTPSKTEATGQVRFEYLVNEETYELVVTLIDISADFTMTRIETASNTTVEIEFKSLFEADTYTWSFIVDGEEREVSDQSTFRHIFTRTDQEQTIGVKLAITKGECTASGSDTLKIPALVQEECHAGFTHAVIRKDPNTKTVVVQFTSEMDDSDTRYTWDFGDGKTSEQSNPTHIYTLSDEQQSFKVTLTVEKGDCKDTRTEAITLTYLNGQEDPVKMIDRNLDILKKLPAHELFKQTLTEDDPVYKGTLDYLTRLIVELGDQATRTSYIQGKNNEKIAAQFEKLFAVTFDKISKVQAPNVKKKRQFVYTIFLVQIDKLLMLVDMQEKDLDNNSPLIGTFQKLKEQLQKLKSLSVQINSDGMLETRLKTSIEASQTRAVYISLIKGLFEVL